MQDDIYDAEVVVTRRQWPDRKIMFRCLICKEDVLEPHGWEAGSRVYGAVREREPVCKGCTRHWGNKNSGPVFNRQNHHTLKQLSAMISHLQWEVRNGDRRHRY